jgi:hypothetical protein
LPTISHYSRLAADLQSARDALARRVYGTTTGFHDLDIKMIDDSIEALNNIAESVQSAPDEHTMIVDIETALVLEPTDETRAEMQREHAEGVDQ